MIDLALRHARHGHAQKGRAAGLQGEFALAMQGQNPALAEELHLLREGWRSAKDTELAAKPEAAQALDALGDTDKKSAALLGEELEGVACRGRLPFVHPGLHGFERHRRVLRQHGLRHIIGAGSHSASQGVAHSEVGRLLPDAEMFGHVFAGGVAFGIDKNELLRLAVLGLDNAGLHAGDFEAALNVRHAHLGGEGVPQRRAAERAGQGLGERDFEKILLLRHLDARGADPELPLMRAFGHAEERVRLAAFPFKNARPAQHLQPGQLGDVLPVQGMRAFEANDDVLQGGVARVHLELGHGLLQLQGRRAARPGGLFERHLRRQFRGVEPHGELLAGGPVLGGGEDQQLVRAPCPRALMLRRQCHARGGFASGIERSGGGVETQCQRLRLRLAPDDACHAGHAQRALALAQFGELPRLRTA